MERLDEAMALAAGLRRDRPNDARAFLGDVWLKSVVRLGAGESVLDVAHASFLAFSQARNLTGRDADFDRVYLSLAFQDVTWSMISGVGSDRPMSEPAFVAAVARVRDLSKQLAATIPAEAAIYGLAADVLDTMRLAAERHAAVARALGEMFPRALAVYEAYPSADSYRLLLSLATVADDWKAASAAITAAPRLDARDADALALSRAQVFVSGAIRAKDWSRLQSLSTLLAVIPRSSDDADREVDLLRSDAEMVRAVHGETVLWTSACSGYSHISWTFPAWDRNRALSNAWAIHDLFQREGDDSDVWVRLRAGNQPDWPVLVNGAAAAFRAGRRDEAAAILKSRTLKVDEHRPDFVVEWLACLEGTPPKPAGPPQAADGNPLVEIVAEGARTSDAATWQVSAALGRPPAHPTLQFILGVQSPWLIASPRACRASEAPQRPDGDR